ncbi:siderophore-interacting protein [Nocardiopsis sp. CNT-189]|uniref:siderophore-interacting protein n=1 Tax=Nocardiopsis oceanisediminis TaxID=2816862 RepID=UPI003B29A546
MPTESAADHRTEERARAVEAEVAANRRIAEHMTRVTVAGEALADPERFPFDGPDQLVRLLFPTREGVLSLPRTADWWKEIQAMDERARPSVRNYTVRGLDRGRRELDIDFVLHGDTGPASAWAGRARPGDRIGLISDGARYAPPADADRLLLVGDETAHPALASIIEGLPDGARALALLESAPGNAPELPDRPGVERIHLDPAPGAPSGTAVLDLLARTPLAGHRPYAWVAGESALATSVRRHLVADRGVPKDRIYFCGYWRRGPRH